MKLYRKAQVNLNAIIMNGLKFPDSIEMVYGE
jgi:hypothetical protein